MATASRDGRPDRSKSAASNTINKSADRGKSAERGTGRPAPGTRVGPKRTHRKGSSSPSVTRGEARINNAKPARFQNVDPVDGEGANYVADGVRLQKVLAQAGVASRRGAEELIAAGRVDVDGEIVTEQGMRIDPATAVVRVDGARVVMDEDMQYLVLNKPKGWQSTMADDQGRPCVGDIVAERVMAGQRLFHVGRLDADTEGLLLLTNDGELAHRLMHPSYEIPKSYLATVKGIVPRGLGRTLKAGIELDDGPAEVDGFSVLEINEGQTLVKLVLHEGRKRIVRRMMDSVGFPVLGLVRTEIGSVNLGNQRPGSLRVLGRKEIGELYKAVGM